MKIRIKDYQAIKDVTLDFKPGVTAIIGQTNNGKSSIIRAIKGAVNNQGGSDFINYDADSTMVDIEIDDNKIIWEKSRKQGKSSYVINGDKLLKIGQTQVPEVANLLNMHEVTVGNERFQINFWKQLDKPFLVDKTAYQLFDFISKSKEQELIATLKEQKEQELKSINKGIDILNAQADSKTLEIEQTKQDIEKLEKFKNFDTKKLELMLNLEDNLTDAIEKYGQLKQTLISNKETLSNSTIIVNKLSKVVEELSNINNQVEAINSYMAEYVSLEIALTNNKKLLDKQNDIISKLETQVTKAGTILDKVNNIKAAKELLELELEKYSNLETILNKYKKQLTSAHSELENAKSILGEIKVCPLCNSKLDNEGEHLNEQHN